MANRGLEALATVPLFEGLTGRHLKHVHNLADEAHFMKGASLVKQGDDGDTFFILLEGQAKVVRGGRTINTLIPGDHFGEISLLDGGVVSGRIDAVYGDPDGPWEVVDWKTGRRPSADDPLASLQLDLYGLACVEIWKKDPADLTLTYLYLASEDGEVSHPLGDPTVVRERAAEALGSIAAGEFEPTPGPQCRYCDFRSFCDAGKAWLTENA